MEITGWSERFCKDLQLKYNSASTRENYLSCIKSFLSRFRSSPDPQHVSNDNIKSWLLEAKTLNTRKHRLCALRAFYSLTVKMPNKAQSIPMPKSDKKLPIILSQEEVQKMFDACINLKHKVILAILYSTGVRVSELLNLKWGNIDRSRMIINIIAGKGKKDRQVPLSPQLIPLLEDYWRQYKPKSYIIEGQMGGRYSDRSVGEVVKQLAIKAGLSKRVYTHLMRHCSFTHMVEEGTDINLIKEIAGHSNVKTTHLYTHLSHNIISRIHSPFQNIKL